MAQQITLQEAAQSLKQAQDVLILSHKSPDGDTLGSGFGLLHALRAMGKGAWLFCQDQIPQKYLYLMDNLSDPLWDEKNTTEPEMVVAVDVADAKLLGERLQPFAGRVDLCIDHHGSNTGYAKRLLLRADAAANCELMLDLLAAMGCPLTKSVANCLYTGLVTDTGCFRYNSTTVDSHRAAQKLLAAGADMPMIHRIAFENVSRGKVTLMVEAMQKIRYELDGQCAAILLERDRINALGVTDDELEGIAALPRQIEGVRVGITLRHYKSYRGYKVSVHTDGSVDASAICARLGGGGHRGAAGCNLEELPAEQVYRLVLDAVAAEMQPRPSRQPESIKE